MSSDDTIFDIPEPTGLESNIIVQGIAPVDSELEISDLSISIDQRVNELNARILELQVTRQNRALTEAEDAEWASSLQELDTLKPDKEISDEDMAAWAAQPGYVKIEDVPNPIMSSLNAAKQNIKTAASAVANGFDQLNKAQKQVIGAISSPLTTIQAYLGGVEQTIKGYAAADLKAFTSFMTNTFGSNCQYKFQNLSLDIKLGTDLIGWASRMGLIGALKCLASGNMFSNVTLKNVIDSVIPKISLQGDFKLLKEVLDTPHEHRPPRTFPQVFEQIAKNFRLDKNSSQAVKAQAYIETISTFDAMQISWDYMAFGSNVIIDASVVLQSNDMFKVCLQAYTDSLGVVFNANNPLSIYNTTVDDRHFVFEALVRATPKVNDTYTELKRQFPTVVF